MDLRHDGSELGKAMRRHPGVRPDVLIEDLAEQLGRDCEVEPPVDMSLVASMQGVSEITETLSSHSGCLITTPEGLRIELSATDGWTRQRFTIGHEVSHTLLPGFELERNFRCNPGASSPKRGHPVNVEWLADVGASELLLPRRFVRDRFAKEPFGWDTIEGVANDYTASLEACARRFVRLSETPAIFVRLVFATSRNNPTPALRVRTSSSSPSLSLFIPPNKSVPRTHPVHDAVLGVDVDTVADMQSLRAPGRYRIAARQYPLPTPKGETVMSVMLIGLKSETHERRSI
ncbi:ImmA/IrrE family metallo-endopeptidase [Microbacterium sp.]|uniref:ImmA/IrrE family metallo-endopeptidase n=1 Tax=Microbacterium sp. TaxID=51671 RepID=UPI002734D070|nr:ImmA/IrrE family metallo-endopeptidase [Microbacterium sp.]MDP3951933.1 ImmA/IrrE family metallo-endopeptidase [Microbacterium sp.]